MKENSKPQPYKPSVDAVKNLSHVPQHRLRLGNYPTPLQTWDFTWKGNSYQFWIKRDDLTEMVCGGNKIRKLDFILPEAVLEGKHDTILSLGPCQSNSCRVITALAPKLGLRTAHVLVKTGENDNDKVDMAAGNLFFHDLFGSELYFVSREEFRSKGQEALLEEARIKLIEQGKATNPFVIPMGGSTISGVFGYIEAFHEIERQILEMKVEVEEIIFACGSGSTAAGLAVGKHLSKNLAHVKLTGFIVWDSDLDHFYQYVDDILGKLGLNQEKVKSKDLVTFIEAHGIGYGESTNEELELLREVAKSSGIVLDSAYTIKALKGWLDLGKENQTKRKSLFIHTGGQFCLLGRNRYVNVK